MADRNKEVRGHVLDRHVRFTFEEMCLACGASREVVIEMVAEGVIEPEGGSGEEWLFHGETLVRARRAIRLVRDLRVNWPGAALALDLLERIERIERSKSA
jgi:chaperone modulatory protein CbpM